MKPSPETIAYLQPVLDWLEKGAPHQTPVGVLNFDMISFDTTDKCGTSCCIAGALKQFHKLEIEQDEPNDAREACIEVGHLIGMTYEQIQRLFFAEDNHSYPIKYLGDITPNQAAKTLAHFMETGEVVWE